MNEQAYGSPGDVGARLGRSPRAGRRDLQGPPVVGLLALGSIASLATAGALLGSDRSTSAALAFLGAGFGLMVLTAGAVAWSRRSRSTAEAPAFVVARERAPTGWRIFVGGFLLALPAVSLYSRVLSRESDSAWLLASILHVQREGIDWIVDTQQVLLPHLLLGPIVSLGGIPALQAFNVVSVLALAGVVAFLSWRLTRSILGAAAATLALTSLPLILERAYLAPMYPTMLALGFLGLYLAYRAVPTEEGVRRWGTAALAAVCLIGSMEAHQVGQLFVPLSALWLLAVPTRRAVGGLARVYLCLAVLYVPRAIINMSEGGLSHFFQNRVEYWVTKDYLTWIQVELFEYPREAGLGEYLRELPGGILDAWGTTGWLTLALGAASVIFAPAPLRRFIVAATLLLLAIFVYVRIPFQPRYFSVLLVGAALGAGLTVAHLARRGTLPWRVAAAVAFAGLVVANTFNYEDGLDRFQLLEARVLQSPYRQFAQQVGPGEGVIGTGSFHLVETSTNPSTYGGQFLTESEYRTFLTWPSEAEVIDLMRRHDAEWILVPQRPARRVARYNDIWLGRAYGEEARYHREVAKSPSFCLEKRIGGAALYRLDPRGPRPPGDQAPRSCPA
jgi:hypothetical protein